MKYWFALVIGLILMVLVGMLVGAEAQVLPIGTVIMIPNAAGDYDTQTLTASGFLLNRDDMNAATIALEQAPVSAKEILDLHTLSDKQQGTINNNRTWQTVIGIGAFILGVVADETVHSLK